MTESVMKSALASWRRPGPFCASLMPDLLVAWSLVCFLLFVPVRVEP
jgi:hypothetical protein